MAQKDQATVPSAEEQDGTSLHGRAPTRLRLLAYTSRILREPFLHFILGGALIFAAYAWLHPAAAPTADPNQIVLTQNDLRQLAVQWIAQGRSPPSKDEMQDLVDQKISEEVLSREAVAMGLDKDDAIIRRRLAQKMAFLAEDIAALQNPNENELRSWYAENASRFAVPPRASFRHLYFSSDRGAKARESAVDALAKVAGKPSNSPDLAVAAPDAFMFQDYYADRDPTQVTREFGPEFAKALFELKPGAWQGPIQSGYGWHLVFVEASEPSRVPPFEEVAPDVKSAWLDQKQRDLKRVALDAMRARYSVVVPPLDTVDLRNLHVPQKTVSATDLVPE